MSTYDPHSNLDFPAEQKLLIPRLSPLQRELLQWLEQHTPSMTAPYVATLTLLQGPDFSGRVTLVCFCMRELGNILPQARNFDNETHSDASSNDMEAATQDALSGAKRKARQLLQALQALPQGDLKETDVARWLDEVHRLMKWFSDHHHFSHKQREWPSDEELRQNVDRFERLLLKFTHTFFSLLRRGEQIIEDVAARGGVPTPLDADHLVAILNWSPEFERPLFDRLSQDWLEPLRIRNLFTNPPADRHWPATKYLARMASIIPAEAAVVLARIDTNNPFVIRDMLKAALVMPPEVAACLVPAILPNCKRGQAVIYFRDATDLCASLGKEGQTDAATKLAEAIFAPTLENCEERRRGEVQHWYKEGLEKVVPVLANRRPHEFL